MRGAEAVNIRRSAGTESPAFRALARGSRVRVEEMSAQWARVTLDDGESGYINVAYLQLEPGATFPPAAPHTPSAAGEPNPAATMAAPAAVVGEAHSEAMEGQLAQLRARLAALESAVVTPQAGEVPAAPVGNETARPAAPLAAPVPDQFDIGPSLALAGVGLVVGFVIGAAYGQRQERHRRSRVRF
ncbi:MAG: SH3 domain-containing protein [bacterium]